MSVSIELPLIPAPSAPTWHGLTVAASEAPEPIAPQGEYALASAIDSIPSLDTNTAANQAVELLAPAGGPDAGFAAFHYGADAIYLGLKKFSARAEAENFTLDELDEVVAYAHSLTPRRRVFVAINTLVLEDELPELIETLAAVEDIGVDALIVQDLGVYRAVRRYFPRLELHASTQLSVHNRAGAETLRDLGFQRVVLARELTFEEVRDITATAGVETEVFVHGALCYAYSGLCLFSAQTLGRSGNRGRCAYSCRDSFDVTGAPDTLRDGTPVRRDPAHGLPFSMKDLALPDHLPALRAAGVSCFKIEGRKKSPLYVATTTDYYRKLIDGQLEGRERVEHEADLRAVFSRPWTRLFVDSHRDKEVADRDRTGHRGDPIGKVDRVEASRLRFRTARALERHDGLQVEPPGLEKPYGFAVDGLWVYDQGRQGTPRPVYEAPAGAWVEVGLPPGCPPLESGVAIYCSSSQAVKLKYRHTRPKPDQFRSRRAVTVAIEVTATEVRASGSVVGIQPIAVRRSLTGSFPVARDVAAVEAAARGAFERLGDTGLTLATIEVNNPAGCFVPVSRWNQLRRDLAEGLEAALAAARSERVERATNELLLRTNPETCQPNFEWSIKIDRLTYVDAFEADDWASVSEIIVDIARDHPTLLQEQLDRLGAQVGRERIRLALPALTRRWEEDGLVRKIARLRELGWTRWQIANVAGWHHLGLDPLHPEPSNLDISTDWSVYALNTLAARQILAMGASRFTLSPEDGLANLRPLLAEFGPRAVLVVYQDTPLFLAESCAYANLIGGCPGKANCQFERMEMVSAEGERVTALDYHCRTIVLNRGPFCLSTRLRDLASAGASSLRADFIYRKYEPAEVRERWRAVRAGKKVPEGHAANFDRGLQ